MSKLEDSETEKNKWRERISKEVNLAVKVQENFLPKRNLTNFPVSGINIPAREVSGDFFSFYPHNESIYFIIADVAGKGIHAGMVMAKAWKIALNCPRNRKSGKRKRKWIELPCRARIRQGQM